MSGEGVRGMLGLVVSAAILLLVGYFVLLCCLETTWYLRERLPARRPVPVEPNRRIPLR